MLKTSKRSFGKKTSAQLRRSLERTGRLLKRLSDQRKQHGSASDHSAKETPTTRLGEYQRKLEEMTAEASDYKVAIANQAKAMREMQDTIATLQSTLNDTITAVKQERGVMGKIINDLRSEVKSLNARLEEKHSKKTETDAGFNTETMETGTQALWAPPQGGPGSTLGSHARTPLFKGRMPFIPPVHAVRPIATQPHSHMLSNLPYSTFDPRFARPLPQQMFRPSGYTSSADPGLMYGRMPSQALHYPSMSPPSTIYYGGGPVLSPFQHARRASMPSTYYPSTLSHPSVLTSPRFPAGLFSDDTALLGVESELEKALGGRKHGEIKRAKIVLDKGAIVTGEAYSLFDRGPASRLGGCRLLPLFSIRRPGPHLRKASRGCRPW
jgi:hypothetical protein